MEILLYICSCFHLVSRKGYPQTMVSLKKMLTSLTTFFSTAFVILGNEFIPPAVRSLFFIVVHYFFTPQFTLIIEETAGLRNNQIYEAATTYLRTKISYSSKSKRIKVSKTNRQEKLSIDIVVGQVVIDHYKNIELKWKLNSEKEKEDSDPYIYFTLAFDKIYEKDVLESYLPYVVARFEQIQKEEKERMRTIKLYSRDCGRDRHGGEWVSINLEHPATFEKLAMDPALKMKVKDDLDRFVRRKELYKKVGKVWKRGYLLYGPPGTGKSSLIAAMANYLKFNIYDLNLSGGRYSDADLRRTLLSTSNRSILVIEDIDCGAQLEDREQENNSNTPFIKFTLSGLLNMIDGLWSSCGDERIIVVTTNHKEKLDPALLRPGRMDVHVHMSYCTMDGFKVLASNYLNIEGDHQLYREIDGLLKNVEVTPAEIAEELLKKDDPDVSLSLRGIVEFLEEKDLRMQ
ncbi:AAA-ATPase At2g18193-like isoform X1 [Castanea sativa]|uniref:AAA-ATPase At2g18193-like isoform X1 n=2 Tax=Castanea sativa TaxID=21020 RepID=UPI003F654423